MNDNADIWYLASPASARPYRHVLSPATCGALEEWRFEAVCCMAAALHGDGHLVYSPIAHTRPIARAGRFHHEYEHWQSFDRSMIRRLHGIMVAMLPGWEHSVGVADERLFARSLGKPSLMIDFIGAESTHMPRDAALCLLRDTIEHLGPCPGIDVINSLPKHLLTPPVPQ